MMKHILLYIILQILVLSAICQKEQYQLVTWKGKIGIWTSLKQSKIDADIQAKGIQHYKNYKIQLIITDSCKSIITRQKSMISLKKKELKLADTQYKNETLRADTNLSAVAELQILLDAEKSKKWWYIGLGVVGTALGTYGGYKVGVAVGKLQ